MTIPRISTLAAALVLAFNASPGSAQFLGNFDAVNTTGKTARGFEIELEGLSVSDISDTFGGDNRGFPTTVERYGAPIIVPYATGVKVIYRATYDVITGNWVAPGGTPFPGVTSIGTPSAVTFQTPGDNCWSGGGIGYGAGTPCDHFGVGVVKNPTKTTYSWLTEDPSTPGSTTKTPVILPSPSWEVVQQPAPAPQLPPPPPIVRAVIEAPEVPEPVQGEEPQFGTAIWAKVFTTELRQPEGLEGLMQGNLQALGIALERRADGTEIEWQLLQKDPGNPESGKLELGGQVLDAHAEAVVRRYEFYEYTGLYKSSDHEAKPLLGDSHADPSEIGAFLGAQNVQALLAPVPEPETYATMLVGLGLLGWNLRSRRRRAAAQRVG
jgi:hypothetical protein